MPLYDYKCNKCGRTEEFLAPSPEYAVNCPQCLTPMTRQFPVKSRFVPRVFPSDGVVIEHAGPQGVKFNNIKEMRQFERAHKCELGYLL